MHIISRTILLVHDETIHRSLERVAKVITDPPERHSAFPAVTIEEMVYAFQDAWADSFNKKAVWNATELCCSPLTIIMDVKEGRR